MLNRIPVAILRGVGSKTTKFLDNLNIRTLQDLLFHLPLRYEDRTQLTPLSALRHGDQTTIEGFIKFTNINRGRKRILFCRIEDTTGSLVLLFYHFSSQQYQLLITKGLRLRCFGTVRQNHWGRLEMVHPEFRVVDATIPLLTKKYLTPVYPTTKGLHQTKLRDLLSQALSYLKKPGAFKESFPKSLRKDFHLPTLIASLIYVHCPPSDASLKLLKLGKHPTQQRLIIEKLVAQQIGLLNLRLRTKMRLAPILNLKSIGQNKLRQVLPFNLTTAQEYVISKINEDLKRSYPMQRLIQGDVGSGKTIVAAMAIVKVVEHGYQCAVMVPTGILAEQHYRTFQQWLEPFGIKVGWMTGSLNNSDREQVLQKIYRGENQLIVGTHALFQENVIFHQLGLIVIDEQHRFGVHQRLALREKRNNDFTYPHQLIMTATPIPRTLALTVYANLDVSTIKELPPGRKAITTILMSNERRDEVIMRIKQSCERGKQVYWVCTLIKDSEILQCEAAEATCQKLRRLLTPLTVGLIHGRLNKNEKDNMMMSFKAGQINLLVATMVIEVGIDVSSASLMIIENAERLGLAQIHQLRGRVGRGKDESYCVLMYQKPLSWYARERLVLLRNSNNGFTIAKKDLELRGPGKLLGTQQAGLLEDLSQKQHLLPQVQKIANQMLWKYPLHVTRLLRRWLKSSENYVEI